MVLKHANIYTVDDRMPKAQAVAVKGDKIVFVGSDADVQPYIGSATHVVNLEGGTLADADVTALRQAPVGAPQVNVAVMA